MTVIDTLIADPIGFLSCNAMNMKYDWKSIKTEPGRPMTFYLMEDSSFEVRYRKMGRIGSSKKDAKAYAISQFDDKPNECFQALWSGYKTEAATHCELPSDSDLNIMLTPTVDGCTLTFDTVANGMKFGHYNLKDGGNTLSGAAMNDAATGYYGNENATVFSKEHYYSKAKRVVAETGDKRTFVNAIGIRQGDQWKFFVQYLEGKGRGYQIRGAEELRAGAKYITAG